MVETDTEWMLHAERRVRVQDLLVWLTPNPDVERTLILPDRTDPVFVGDDLLVAASFSPRMVVAYHEQTGEIAWKKLLDGYCHEDPVGSGGMVLLAAGNTLSALAADSGKVVWSVELEQSGPWTGPIVHEDIVAFGAGEGSIRAVTLDAGEPVWQTRLPTPPGAMIAGCSFRSEGDLLVQTNTGVFFCLNIGNGELLWERQVDAEPWDLGERFNGQLITHTGQRIRALNRMGTNWTWESPDRTIEQVCVAGTVVAAVVSEADAIPAPGMSHMGMRYQPEHLIGLRDGKAVWTLPYPPYIMSKPVWSSETHRLYEATSRGLGVVDVEAGVREWVIEAFPDRRGTEDQRTCIPLVTSKRIYCLTADGSLLSLRHP